ncbi:hypothetical protein TNCV_2070101 [Trichonephila clavipes]|uniref:Uncharacterized protein n=1 Tax=Trichonephila clavipes TaxID=2585209 RepID=A0A8X7BD90_TRICX|nr:hypothetical protein TNCV_2070101 [Trichonephila clavipes]
MLYPYPYTSVSSIQLQRRLVRPGNLFPVISSPMSVLTGLGEISPKKTLLTTRILEPQFKNCWSKVELVPKPDEIGNFIEEVVDLARQIHLEVQELPRFPQSGADS